MHRSRYWKIYGSPPSNLCQHHVTARASQISIIQQCENFFEIQVVFQTYANWTSNLLEPSSRAPMYLDLCPNERLAFKVLVHVLPTFFNFQNWRHVCGILWVECPFFLWLKPSPHKTPRRHALIFYKKGQQFWKGFLKKRNLRNDF